mgnify:CR=1 FL=1
MFEKIRKMKNQKGFTLVELIVVLVILAILAALLVPALTGYIDKANKEKVIATTRMVVMAAQTEISEKYGLNASGELKGTFTGENKKDEPLTKDSNEDKTNADGISMDAIAKLAEVAVDKNVDSAKKVVFQNGVTKISISYTTKGEVVKAVVEQSGFTCTYDANTEGDKYTVSK